MPVSKRERARLQRKKHIIEQQAQQFEDEISGHELNLARLDALPEKDRDESWQPARAAAEHVIKTCRGALAATLAQMPDVDDAG